MSNTGKVAPSAARVIGSGIAVYHTTEVVEGPVVFLDSPEDVMDFVDQGVTGSIVISRGGATTFMAPVLVVGVRGLITLQGSPESHLGILAREYGIPCVMAVHFSEGVSTERGETIPADGTVIRVDVSSEADGRVLLVEGN
jgi:signal transduction protein with GAF and PtsI domain